MALPLGTWLNHYEVLGHLGTGGMGEVYRARDNKLQREVALKVLPKAFAQDPERVARFRREAQVLAQLNHVNIAAIYSVEQSGETHFLVMELAEGETLRDRIQRGNQSRDRKGAVASPTEPPLAAARGSDGGASGVPLEEALDIAKQICEALEHAHEKPIIHRDLKPANVKLTPEGKVKVLDFGLAKAFAGDSSDPVASPDSNSPTVAPNASPTLPGVILGTAAYMSPEQARGKKVDKRTDIWALGCVLYELLTGKQVFQGEGIPEILAAVMKGEPDWTALPPTTPRDVRNLLRRSLQKDVAKRFHSIADIALGLEDALNAPEATTPTTITPVLGPIVASKPVWWRVVPWAATFALGLIVAGTAVWNLKPAPPAPVSRVVIPLPVDVQLSGTAGPTTAFSPDGTQLAYLGSARGGTQRIYLRAMDSLEALPITGTEGAFQSFFSPDGQWIAFWSQGKYKKVSVSGGATLSLCDAPAPRGAAWGSNDTIVFTPTGTSPLLQVSAAGGAPQHFTTLRQGETSHRWPHFLPDGKTVLFAAASVAGGVASNFDDADIAVASLDTPEHRILVRGGTYPHYVPTGHLVYYRGGTLMAAPFDLARLEVTGTAAPALEGIMSSSAGFGAGQFSFSNLGSLAYVPGSVAMTIERTLVWVDRKGTEQALPAPAQAYDHPQLSPDGRQLALTISGQSNDIWIYDLSRGTLTRLTFEGSNQRPLWTPDGKDIVFRSDRGKFNVFQKSADGTGAEEQLTQRERIGSPSSISPDGRLAFYTDVDQATGRDIWTLSLDGERKATLFLQTPFDELAPRISPDGRWLTYVSNESGRNEVYVRPFPASSGKWQISTEGGGEPLWARSGRELFYRTGDKLMAVGIAAGPSFQAATPQLLFGGSYVKRPGEAETNFDISPDGQRFLLVKAKEEQQESLSQIHVVLNWFEELKRRVPTGR